MTKEELRAKYARVPADFSELEMLKDQLLESGLLEAAQKDPENAGKALVYDEEGAIVAGEAGGGNDIITLTETSEHRLTVKEAYDLLTANGASTAFCHYIKTTNPTKDIYCLCYMQYAGDYTIALIMPAYSSITLAKLTVSAADASSTYFDSIFSGEHLKGISPIDIYFALPSDTTENKTYNCELIRYQGSWKMQFTEK